jgi:(1->4)-alpha-D-glucan 1-alpha-D-glucosylmutase
MRRREIQSVYAPSATYRFQFNRSFTFEQATGLVEYLDELGISDIYASPFLMARPGSVHGYDVTNHARFNPEIGDEESFVRLAQALDRRRMGLIADLVPNHMCISDASNGWWWDVLENGPSSAFARCFDIDWRPPKEELVNKVLLPVLGDQFGRVLENREIQIVFNAGQFQAAVYETLLPLAPATWIMILEPAAAKLREKLGESHAQVAELESIITSLSHLPGSTETDEARIRERQREKEIVKRRLSGLLEAGPEAGLAIEASLTDINGREGEPRSFDRLERLLESEAYRLSFWRVAMDEINYRRFFDVNDLAAIRVEDPEVFSAVHALIFHLVRRGLIRGLRVDHPDGLFEPENYFRALQEACRACNKGSNGDAQPDGANRMFYIVAEKILTGNEPLRTEWPVQGTTGYGFLNLANGLFVDHTKQKAFELLYRRFTGWSQEFDNLVCDSKRLILQVAMSSELNVLARKLDRISEQHRWSRDFTLESLRDALREVLAAFPVYRTYVRSSQTEVDPQDRRQVIAAMREAKRRNPAISESVFDFIQGVLLLDRAGGVDDAQQAERQMFVMRFQQLSSPVMAKGVEDTAFYRYCPLASLNEVGGDPSRFGVSSNAFHRRNLIRRELWPNSMSASSTHDTKRGEDVRARINVLSEIPGDWYRAIRRWRGMNRAAKTVVGNRPAPDANEEYLLYQTLIGTWPLFPMNAGEHREYTRRIEGYMQKALHEAKVHTSWINPNGAYEEAVTKFVERILEATPENAFLRELSEFQAPIARAGMWNSLAQVLVKIASPGVPDFYQGNEIWALDLVDPDNRRSVNYEVRRQMLASLRAQAERSRVELVSRLRENLCDGAIKMFITSEALRFRRDHPELFSQGTYAGLAAEGSRTRHVVGFARATDREMALALTGRFFLRLCNSDGKPIGEVWGDTAVALPKNVGQQSFQNIFTGQTIVPRERDGRMVLPLNEAFCECPVALLYAESRD